MTRVNKYPRVTVEGPADFFALMYRLDHQIDHLTIGVHPRFTFCIKAAEVVYIGIEGLNMPHGDGTGLRSKDDIGGFNVVFGHHGHVGGSLDTSADHRQ